MTQTPQTPLRARISNGYRVRLALIGVGLTAFGCWALYDGLVKYPKNAQVYAEFEQMKEDREDWASAWGPYAAERGYEVNPNNVDKVEEKDIWTQYVMAGLCLPIGGFFLFNFLRATGRKVEADDLGIRGREGDAPWDRVRDLDDSRWRTKGIAQVTFEKAGGGEGKILLDDWKFEREPTVRIHDRVMEKLGRTPEGGEAATETPPVEGETAIEAEPAAAPDAAAADQPLRP